jgi:acyl-CoA dehydrogenase
VSEKFIHVNLMISLPFSMQGINPAKRKAIYFAAAKTLADVHKVDVSAVGLQKYGKRDNYCKRQVGLL